LSDIERAGVGTLWLPGQRVWGRVGYRIHEERPAPPGGSALSGRLQALDRSHEAQAFADLVGRPVQLRLATGEWWLCSVADAEGTVCDRAGLIPAGPWPRLREPS
jgi:hypothetical protein